MIAKSTLIQIGELDIYLTRKPIKNLHINVMPPDGQIRVSAPEAMTETAIRMAVIHRIPWIRRQQSAFAKQQRQSAREMVNGETHYLWGRRYRLEVIESDNLKSQTVKLKGGRLILTVNTDASEEAKRKLLSEYYRGRLKARAPDLIDKWSKQTGIAINSWQVQKMKTKWGSCNIESGNIRLNLDLAKKPLACLEYIILHELLHFKERQHNARFKTLLDTYMSDWRSIRDLLNQMPLDQESWRQRD